MRPLLPLLHFLVVALAAAAVPGFALAERSPGVHLLSPFDHVASTSSSVGLSVPRHVPERQEAAAWLLAVPPGLLSLELSRVELEHVETKQRRIITHPPHLNEIAREAESVRALTVSDLGILRRVRIAKVHLRPDLRLRFEGEIWNLLSFQGRVRFPAWKPEAVEDSALTAESSHYRQLLEAAVANPEGIALYAQANPPPATAATTPELWQPRAEQSRPEFPWLKIPIVEEGIYVLDGRWLAEHGLDPGTIDPTTLKLISRGAEVPLLRRGSGTFSQGARLLFHATGNDSRETAERVYFLGQRTPDDQGRSPELLAPPIPADAASLPRVRTFRRTLRVEQDEKLETKVGNFLAIRAMNWVWKQLPLGETVTVLAPTPGLPYPTPRAFATFHFYYAGEGLRADHTLQIDVNGRQPFPPLQLIRSAQSFETEIGEGILQPDQNTVTLHLEGESGTHSNVHLDAIEFHYDSLIKGDQGRLWITSATAAESTGTVGLEAIGFRAQRLLALDLTLPDSPALLPVQAERGNATVWTRLTPESRILLIEEDAVPRAPAAHKAPWRDWRLMQHSADGLIISHGDFLAEAELLAVDARQRGEEVIVLDVESLYDAYSLGEVSTAAIRAALAEATLGWTGRKPSWAILLGDATSDGRGLSRTGIRNLIPTNTQRKGSDTSLDDYAVDHQFAWLAGEDELGDLLLGRISVNSVNDAQAVVGKTLGYRQQEDAAWARRMVFFADGGEFSDRTRELFAWTETPFNLDGEFLEEMPWEPNFYLPSQVLMGKESRVSSHASRRIQKAFEEGAGLLTWYGHGSPNIWSNQRVWFGGDSPNSDNSTLRNADRLPFVVAFTCNNGAIDYPLPRWNISISEDMHRVPEGGAVALFVPSGPGYSKQHQVIGQGILDAFGKLNLRSLGVSAELGRLRYQALRQNDDHSRMFIFLGDPTLELPVPVRPTDAVKLKASPRPAEGSVIPWLVEVSSASPATSAVLTVEDADGNELLREVPQWNGLSTATLSLPLELQQGSMRLRVKVFGAGGIVGTAAINLVPPALERGALRAITLGDPLPTGREVVVALGNENAEPLPLETTFTWFGNANTTETLPSLREVVAPGDSLLWRHDLSGEPGFSMLQAVVRSGLLPDGDLVRHQPVVLLDPTAQGAVLGIIPGSLNLRTDHPSAQGEFELHLGNVGASSGTGRATLEALDPRGKLVASTTQVVGSIPSGGFAPLRLPIQLPRMIEERLDLTARLEGLNGAQVSARDATTTLTLRREHLADLRWIPGSFRIEGYGAVAGRTVMLTGMVENRGAVPSAPTTLELRDAAGTPLPNAAESSTQGRIPSLAPGESHVALVRWDTTKDVVDQTVTLLIDPRESLLEQDRQNNSAEVPVRFRQDWKLAAGELTIKPAGSTQLQLTAMVSNLGDETARDVNVIFYREDRHLPSEQIGEVQVASLPGKAQARVTFLWDLQGVTLRPGQKLPTFTVGIRGSLIRYASTGAPSPP